MLDTSIFSRTSSGGKEISEKRLLKINYQGSSNYSTLTYDGFGECVKIVETTGGSITSTKQFVRSGNIMREARDASGTLTAQYFGLGQTGTGANYYFHFNQRGDVVGVTDSTGNQVASIAYDPYGRPTVLSGSFTPDFGFTGLYIHQRSGLNLATYRAYSSSLGRWINRDPIGEKGNPNLFAYVHNKPVAFIDRLGNFDTGVVPGVGIGVGVGVGGVAGPIATAGGGIIAGIGIASLANLYRSLKVAWNWGELNDCVKLKIGCIDDCNKGFNADLKLKVCHKTARKRQQDCYDYCDKLYRRCLRRYGVDIPDPDAGGADSVLNDELQTPGEVAE